MTPARRTIGLSRIEIAMILDGLALVKKKAQDTDDLFRAEVAEMVIDHLKVVRAKMTEKS